MPGFAPSKIRNVAIVGHSHEGKTSLAEALLFASGQIERMGRPDQGNTVMDFEPEEVRRHLSINLSCAHVIAGDVKVNLLDTPGFFDFSADARAAVQVADAAVIVAAANPTVSVGTELAWHMSAQRPRLLAITKLDKDNANFATALDAIRASVSPKPVAVQLPLGQESGFNGVIDLLTGRAVTFNGNKVTETKIPEAMTEAVATARASLAEAAAEGDDELLEKYLDSGELTDAEVLRGLRESVLAGTVVPAVPFSATTGVGAQTLLDAIVQLLPSAAESPGLRAAPVEGGEGIQVSCDPEAPALAYVFKTTADPFVGRLSFFKVLRGTVRNEMTLVNPLRHSDEKISHVGLPRGKTQASVDHVDAGDIGVVAKLHATQTGDSLCAREQALQVLVEPGPEPGYIMCIEPTNRNDEAKIGAALAHLLEEDPGLRLTHHEVTQQTLLHGFGDVQLEVACEKLKRKYGVEAQLHPPRVPFTETVSTTVKAEKKYKKQSGGAGMYGHCVIEIAPGPRGSGFTWEDKIFGGSIPQPLRPSVERGVHETMETGVISGNPVVDVKVTLLDGSTHPVDGKDMAFRLAGAMAMREGVTKANPVLLEPVMEVQVVVPDRFMGDVMGDIPGRRGKIVGTEQLGDGHTEVRALVPQLELLRYALDLRSLTQGRGTFTMHHDHMDEMPAHLAQPIVQEYQKLHPHKED